MGGGWALGHTDCTEQNDDVLVGRGGAGYSGGGFGRNSTGGIAGGPGNSTGQGEAGEGQSVEVRDLSTQHFNITPGNYL